MNNSNSIILTQGYKPIVIVFIIAMIIKLFFSSFLGNIGLLATLFTIYVYRDPNIYIFTNSNNILSPIDGVITAIDYQDGKKNIYCKINICDTHVVRAPQDGELKIEKYQHGLNLSPNSYKGGLLNEQITFKFDSIKLKLISGMCNPKIQYLKKIKVDQGENFALFFDGMAVIAVDKDKEIFVKIGDKLKSGQTMICKK